MPILDLNGAKPLFPKPERTGKKRTLGDPGTVPTGMFSGGGGSGFTAARIDRLTKDF